MRIKNKILYILIKIKHKLLTNVALYKQKEDGLRNRLLFVYLRKYLKGIQCPIGRWMP